MLRFFGSKTNKKESHENKPALHQVLDFIPSRIATVNGHSEEIYALKQLSDGRLISSTISSTGSEIRMWNLSAGECERKIDEYINSIFRSNRPFERPLQNGHLVFMYTYYLDPVFTNIGLRSNIIIYNPQNGTYKRGGFYYGPLIWETTIWLQLQNERLAIISHSQEKSLISILSKSLSKIRFKIEQPGEITALIQLKNGYLVSGSRDGKIHVFDPSDGRFVKAINASPDMSRLSIITLMQHTDGRLLSLTSEKIAFWNVSSGICEANICLDESDDGYMPHGLQELPDGRLVVIGLIGAIYDEVKKIGVRIYDASSYLCVKTFLASDFTNIKSVSMEVLSDGRLAISEGSVIQIWDIGFRPILELDLPLEKAHLNPVSSATSTALSTLQIEGHAGTAPALSQSEFEKMVYETQSSAARLLSVRDIAQDLGRLRQHIQNMDGCETLSSEEKRRLRARIAADKLTEALLIERQNILMNPSLKIYYHALQTYISELMVASLGVGSGYIPVDNSKGTKIVGWICCAISSVFPGVSIASSMISTGASYLDAQYRKSFLDKVSVLGVTVTEAEILGEQVARLLVRAHYHAGHGFSAQSAENDAKALIAMIVRAEIPFIRDEETSTRLVEAIWGGASSYCAEPIPSQKALKTSTLQNEDGFQDLGAPSVVSMSTLLVSSDLSIQELNHQVEEERAERKRLEKEFAQHRTQAALKSEVASQKEVRVLRQQVDKLAPSTSQGGLTLMSPSQTAGDSETKQLELEKRFAYMEEHLGVLTTDVMTLKEGVRSSRPEATDRIMHTSVQRLPKKNMFSNPANLQLERRAKQTEAESKAFEDSKKKLFNI